MQFLKESFLRLNTYDQIRLGIITVTLTILLICVFLLSIVSLIIINTSYQEIKGMMEFKENDQINSVSIYVDSDISMITDISKLYTYKIRRFFENNQLNPDFINNFTNKKLTEKYFTNADNNPQKYLLKEKCFGENIQSNQNLINKKKIFSSLLPIFEYTLNHTFYRGKKNNPLFKSINYYDIDNKCLFFIEGNKAKYFKNYNYTIFKNYLEFQINYLNSGLENYISNYDIEISKKSIAISLMQNPQIFGYFSNAYFEKNFDGINSMATSIKLSNSTQDKVTNETIKFTNDEILDIINFEFNENFIEETFLKVMNLFKGFKLIINNVFLNGINTCKILIKKNLIYENLDSKTNYENFTKFLGYKNDSACFLTDIIGVKESNSSIKNYYSKYVDSFDIKNYRRFVKIPIAFDKINKYNKKKEVLYKVLRSYLTDITTRILINNIFTTWSRPSIILLKSYSILENIFNKIYRSFSMDITRIFALNIFISILTSTFIIINTFIVSKNIGDPIRDLNQTISIIQNNNKNNLEENENEEDNQIKKKLNVLDSIQYKDDNTINQFFEICKKLIKGGFNLHQENLDIDKNQIDIAYNNISYIKMNNLIVQEEKILMENNNQKVHKVFDHISIINNIRNNNFQINEELPMNKSVSLIYNNSNMNKSTYYSSLNNSSDFIDNTKNPYEIKNFSVMYQIEKKDRRGKRTNYSTITNYFENYIKGKKVKFNTQEEGSPNTSFTDNGNIFGTRRETSMSKKWAYLDQSEIYSEKLKNTKPYFNSNNSNNLRLNYYMMNSLLYKDKDIENSNSDNKNENNKISFKYDKIIRTIFKDHEIKRIFYLCDKFENLSQN
jgi:hypothetical protein